MPFYFLVSSSLSSVVFPAEASLNSRMPRPKPRASSGSLRPPKNNNMTTKIMVISWAPIPKIKKIEFNMLVCFWGGKYNAFKLRFDGFIIDQFKFYKNMFLEFTTFLES